MGRLLALLGALLLAGCVTGGGGKEEVRLDSETFSFGRLQFDTFDAYQIAPGDVLDVLFQIKSWEDLGPYRIGRDDQLSVKFPAMPTLNELQPVRPDGTISLPYLGVVRVEGKTVDELTADLRARYSKILRHPDVYVTVPAYLSQLRELKADLHTAPRGLSRLVTVAPDGSATFPMIGHLKVTGQTIPAVNDELNRRFAGISPLLRVDLFLEQHAGSVVYVLGEVEKGGAYAINRPLMVAQAIALAGGFRRDATLSRVVVVRRQGDKMVLRKVDLETPLGGQPGAFFQLMPDDVVYVPRSSLATARDIVQDLSAVLMFRGWSLGASWDAGDMKFF